MNPFSKPIKFKEAKLNHFYVIKENNQFLKINEPKIGQEVYEIPCVSGGESKPLVLEIPIPLCEKHIKEHNNKKFGVHTCNNWYYIAIPVQLGSLKCRECQNELFLPEPYLSSADLRSANLYSANLSSANLSSADLRSADLRSAYLYSANLYSANLYSANLSSADLYSANLYSANLYSANLSSANLSSADLSSADLSSANLYSANLRSANLSSAGNINKSLNLDKAYWDKFTQIDEEYKKLLSRDRFLE